MKAAISYNDLQWLKTAAVCNKVRNDVARLIYFYLGKHEIFSAFHCSENKDSLLLIYSVSCL